MQACMFSILEGVAARLIAAGAKFDLVDFQAKSALRWSCVYHHASAALLLAEAGAALNLVDINGKSALDEADEKGLAAVSTAIRARGGRTGAELRAGR
jgi:ankyrin repeat protein